MTTGPVELVRIDRRGRVERLADRRAARASSLPRFIGTRGPAVVAGWTEGSRNHFRRLAHPARQGSGHPGIFRQGSRTLVLSTQGAGLELDGRAVAERKWRRRGL